MVTLLKYLAIALVLLLAVAPAALCCDAGGGCGHGCCTARSVSRFMRRLMGRLKRAVSLAASLVSSFWAITPLVPVSAGQPLLAPVPIESSSLRI